MTSSNLPKNKKKELKNYIGHLLNVRPFKRTTFNENFNKRFEEEKQEWEKKQLIQEKIDLINNSKLPEEQKKIIKIYIQQKN